jgi:hypothetical protein
MPATPPSAPDYPAPPDRVESQRHAGVFLHLVELTAGGDVIEATRVLQDYVLGPDDMRVVELHCGYLAAIGALLTAVTMDAPDAPTPPSDGYWMRITRRPSTASRAERTATKAIALHRAGDVNAANDEQYALLRSGGPEALLEMALVVVRICAEVSPPRLSD